MSKFNKGDRVRCVISDSIDAGFGIGVGDTGTVAESGSRDPFVKWDRSGEKWCTSEEHLELIEE